MTAPQAKDTARSTRKALPKKQPGKAPTEKAPKKVTTARVTPLPKDAWKLPRPATLTWIAKTMRDVDYQVAEGERHLYRVHQGDDCKWFAQQKLKTGSWSAMAGACESEDEAKTLAGFNEAGALWLAYSNVVGTPFAKLVQTFA
jgi:hypothetical protein